MIRVSILFLLCFASLYAQTSGMRWLEAPEHSLGIYTYSPYTPTWIRDTLRFINTLPEPLVITKLHVAGPERFSCTWTTAPGDTGYIWFEEQVRPGSFVEIHEVRLNIQTKTWPWEMAILHFLTLSGMEAQQFYSGGAAQMLSASWRDGQPLRQELWLYPNGMPMEAGLCAAPEGYRLGSWKCWNTQGIPLPDTSYLVPFMLHAYLPGGNHISNPVCTIVTNGQNSTPWGYMNGGTFHLWLPHSADTLLISSGEYLAVMDLSWFLRQSHPSASVQLMLPGDPYVVMNHIPVPFSWSDSCFGILWEPTLTHDEIQSEISALQKAYPYFQFRHQHHQQWYLVLPHSSTAPEEKLFPELIRKYPITKFSRCIAGAFGHRPAWFSGQIGIQVIVPMSPEQLNALANRYHCTLTPSSPGSGYWTLTYQGSLMDHSFVHLLNTLSTEPGLGICVPDIVMHVPIDPLWDE